jgi:glycosyltransferase involved in cell wall biosynthesis
VQLLRVIGGLDPRRGGPSESALNACIATQQAGVTNSFAFPHAEQSANALEPVRRWLEREGVAVHSFPLFPDRSSKAERWAVSPALARWVAQHAGSYDVVHVHGGWGLSSLAAVRAAERAGVPSVMSPHESLTGYDVGRPGSRLRILAKTRLRSYYLRKLALLVFASELERRDTLNGAACAESTVLYHPLRPTLIADHQPGSQPRGPLRVGYLGRIHPKKNLEVLIRAVSLASGDAKLLIAGNGPEGYVRMLERLAEEVGMANRIEWHGFLEGDERWPFIDDLDLFALPSHYECFGMAAAEAMARGIPTVVATTTGLREIIEPEVSGLIAPPTAQGFASAIRQCDSDRDLLALLKVGGSSVVRRELSMDRYADQIVPYYQTLISRKKKLAKFEMV